MVKIDLITGFLGAGKTTFLRAYAGWLIKQGYHIGILENDFGAVNVDLMLLQDLEGENCELEMVSGGCDKDCHRRRFKTKLIAMGMSGFERVLVEPSGIYDRDEFFDALQEEPLDRWYEAGNVFAIVDGRLPEDLSEAAEYLLATEAADAGTVLLSRAQEADDAELDATVTHLNRALEKIGCSRRPEKEIIRKNWFEFTDADFEALLHAGYRLSDYCKKPQLEEAFDSLFFMHVKMTEAELSEAVQAAFADANCGHIFRIKGFLPTEDGFLELNATRREIAINPISRGQEILIVIGEGLSKTALEKYFGTEKGE